MTDQRTEHAAADDLVAAPDVDAPGRTTPGGPAPTTALATATTQPSATANTPRSAQTADPTRPVEHADTGDDGFTPWRTPTEGTERAFVLAGGGATGIAWEAGVIIGLRDGGVDVREADTMIGTSAGSMVAAHVRLGTEETVAFERIREGAPLASYGRLGAADATRYLRAQLHLDARRGRALVGRAALGARTATEQEWLDTIGLGLVGQPWPQARLLVTAVDARTGTAVVFDRDSGVPLERAVAASCAVPGVFPAVEVGGRRYVDGGLRTIANIDLAAGHRRVVALAPYPVGSHVRDLPPVQLRRLKPRARTALVVPDARDLRAMGTNPLDMRRGERTFDAAREHGRRIAERVGDVWHG
ncbi:patatin-like phospholipase family protein [Oryzobacter sp. R7]|uniref:patatin-like phospholipase family protein n=1 Tax=Oryzobacter faecalis TaxID=3388656 RepID=UPI00398C8688